MSVLTIYCVQTFAGKGGYQVRARLHQFGSEHEARELGAVLGRKGKGVMVFRVSGEPDFDWWDEPVVLERYGCLPLPYI